MSNVGEAASINIALTVSTEDGGTLPTEREFKDLLENMFYNGDTEITEAGLDILDIEVSNWDGDLNGENE